MSESRGRTVLITGGASGIGRLTGRLLLERGAARLVIWDVQEALLREAVQELAAPGHQVTGFTVDLADAGQIQGAVQEMQAQGIGVDILVNNAGIVVGRPFAEHTAADITRTMDINANAPMLLTLALLPGMLARRSGRATNRSVRTARRIAARIDTKAAHTGVSHGSAGQGTYLSLPFRQTRPL